MHILKIPYLFAVQQKDNLKDLIEIWLLTDY